MTSDVTGSWTRRGLVRLRRFLTNPANLLVTAVLVFAGVEAIESLWLPLGWDSGMMASVGDVIARGGMPYRDGWDLKGPLAYLPYTLSILLTGHSMWGVRLFELIVWLPCLYLVFRTISAWSSWRFGAVAAAGLHLWIESAGFAYTAQPEVWATAAIASAMCLLLRPDATKTATPAVFLLIGVLIGCASMIKPHFAGFGLAPLVFLAMTGMLLKRLWLAAALAAGSAIPVVILIWWIAAGGALPAMLDIVAFLAGPYGDAHSLSGWRLYGAVLTYLVTGAMPVAIVLTAIGVWARRRDTVLVATLLTWLFVGAFSVIVQAKLYAYHWFPIFPPLVIGAALGAHALLTRMTPLARIGAALGLIAIVSTTIAAPVRDVARWTRFLVDHDWEKFYGSHYVVPYNARDIVGAARHVRERTDPSESVYVWGNDATIRYLSQRTSPTRFTFVLPLQLRSDSRDLFRAELMEALRGTPPAYIAIGGPWGETGPFGPKARSWEDFPEFEALLTNDYRLEATIGNVDLYVRGDR